MKAHEVMDGYVFHGDFYLSNVTIRIFVANHID